MPDNSVVIEGKHEEKSGSGGSHFVQNQFKRQFTIPAGCNPLEVSSNLSRDGILVVCAPKRQQPKLGDGERKIPIGHRY